MDKLRIMQMTRCPMNENHAVFAPLSRLRHGSRIFTKKKQNCQVTSCVSRIPYILAVRWVICFSFENNINSRKKLSFDKYRSTRYIVYPYRMVKAKFPEGFYFRQFLFPCLIYRFSPILFSSITFRNMFGTTCCKTRESACNCTGKNTNGGLI